MDSTQVLIIVGIVGVILTGALVAFEVVKYLQRRKKENPVASEETAESPAEAFGPVNVSKGSTSAEKAVVLDMPLPWLGALHRTEETIRTWQHNEQGQPSPSTDSPVFERDRETRKKGSRMRTVLFDGSVEVPSPLYNEFHGEISKGTLVTGSAREESGQTFDFYIMDTTNYRRFRRDRSSEEVFAVTDRTEVQFKLTIPKTDTWYFVVDTYRKQYDRSVRLRVATVDH